MSHANPGVAFASVGKSAIMSSNWARLLPEENVVDYFDHPVLLALPPTIRRRPAEPALQVNWFALAIRNDRGQSSNLSRFVTNLALRAKVAAGPRHNSFTQMARIAAILIFLLRKDPMFGRAFAKPAPRPSACFDAASRSCRPGSENQNETSWRGPVPGPKRRDDRPRRANFRHSGRCPRNDPSTRKSPW